MLRRQNQIEHSRLNEIFSEQKILNIIAEYFYDIKSVTDPATQQLLSDPVVLLHPKMDPIVYNKSTTENSDELKKIVSATPQVPLNTQPIPFIKELVEYISNPKNDSKLPIDVENQDHPSTQLMNLLNDPNINQEINLANALNQLILETKKQGKKEIDLSDFLKNFKYPIIKKSNFLNHKTKNKLVYLPAFVDALSLVINVMNKISNDPSDHSMEKLLLPGLIGLGFYFNHQVQRYSINWQYLYSPEFNPQKKSLQKTLIFRMSEIVAICQSIASNLIPYTALTPLQLGALSLTPWTRLSLTAPISSMLTKSTTTPVCTDILLRELDGNLRNPLPPNSLLSLSLTALSMANLYVYYDVLRKENLTAWGPYLNYLAAALAIPASIPRFLLASRYSAEDIKAILKNPRIIFEAKKDEDGFTESKESAHFRLFTRFSGSLAMAVMTYALTENPAYALIAAFALLNESSLPYAIKTATNRYRLLPPASPPEEKELKNDALPSKKI